MMQKKLPQFVRCLFVLQPILDCVSYWMERRGLSNGLTLALRLAVLCFTVICAYTISEKKRAYWIAAGVCALLLAGHLYAVFDYGVSHLFSDLTNFVRVIQLPVLTLCFITFLKTDRRCYDAILQAMAVVLMMILAVEALSWITGTELHTYDDGSGIIGWFSNTNSQSCILCVVVPVGVLWAMRRGSADSLRFWILLIGGFGAMYLLGTRLAFAAMLLSGVVIGGMLLWQRRRKEALALIGCAAALAALVMYSPMVRHQRLYNEVQSDRQSSINSQLSQFDLQPLDEPGLSPQEYAARKNLWIEALTPIYERYAPDFTELFGVEQTIEIYRYSIKITDITTQRPKKLQFARLLMEDSPASARWFGLELSRFTVGENNYDVENDFHGIYYLYGAAGLCAMLAFFAFFLWRMARSMGRDPQAYLTPEAAAWTIALGSCLVHAYFTAGVLRRPNASFYLAAVLAAVYYLTEVKEAKENRRT